MIPHDLHTISWIRIFRKLPATCHAGSFHAIYGFSLPVVQAFVYSTPILFRNLLQAFSRSNPFSRLFTRIIGNSRPAIRLLQNHHFASFV